MSKLWFVLIMLCLGACSMHDDGKWRSAVSDPEYLHRSIKHVTDVVVYDIFSPPVASRIYSYVSVAAYEAAIAGDSSYASLAGQLHGLKALPRPEPGLEYSFPLASVEAVHKVGRALVFSEDLMDQFHQSIMTEIKDKGIPSDVYDRSVAFGDQIADAVLAWSAADKYKESRSFPKYSISDDPGTWRPTPPAYFDAVEPHWKEIRTFVIDSAQEFKPPGALAFSIDKSSPFFKQAEQVREIVDSLTPEQNEIAFFWDCNPFVMNVKGHVMFALKKISPGGHWMNITHLACKGAKKNFAQSAEAYVRVAVSLADGFISSWEEKYRSNSIRPETYINQYIDEAWTPVLQTPPFPEYTSAHSVISASAAEALTSIFGEPFSFVDSTEQEFGLAIRSFKSFREAAAEAGVSRNYGGIHYLRSCTDGLVEGKKVGEFIVSRLVTSKTRKAVEAAPVASVSGVQ